MNLKQLEIYIHIPFCVKKCSYCDFLSAPATKERQEAYVDALFSELEGRAEEYAEYEVVSVFIGGGTPSVLDAPHIVGIMSRLKRLYTLAAEAEISIEVNPGTADREKLAVYHRAGINRLSIGLQSANDDELKKLGRIHDYRQFLDTYYAAREVGFTNVNVDVMSALPGQSPESYQDTLERLLALEPSPEHISAYSLIVEEGTTFGCLAEEGKLDLPDEDAERFMYEQTADILGKAGFHRYEISNYAKEGFECLHNCGYWERREYVGFGIGAASLVGKCRFQNNSDLAEYIKSPLTCRLEYQELSKEEEMSETMFLGLRMTRGVSCKRFREVFGQSPEQVYGDVIRKNIADGLLQYVEEAVSDSRGGIRETAHFLALTEKGLDLSNYVMAQFV